MSILTYDKENFNSYFVAGGKQIVIKVIWSPLLRMDYLEDDDNIR